MNTKIITIVFPGYTSISARTEQYTMAMMSCFNSTNPLPLKFDHGWTICRCTTIYTIYDSKDRILL